MVGVLNLKCVIIFRLTDSLLWRKHFRKKGSIRLAELNDTRSRSFLRQLKKNLNCSVYIPSRQKNGVSIRPHPPIIGYMGYGRERGYFTNILQIGDVWNVNTGPYLSNRDGTFRHIKWRGATNNEHHKRDEALFEFPSKYFLNSDSKKYGLAGTYIEF